MSEKECTKCGEVKPFSEYHKDKGSKDGHMFSCKSCRKKMAQGLLPKRRKKYCNIELQEKECTKCGEIRSFSDYHKNGNRLSCHCKPCRKKESEANKERDAAVAKAYRKRNAKDISRKNKIRYQEKKDYWSETQKKYRKNNKGKIREQSKIYMRRKRAENATFRYSMNIRSRVSKLLSGVIRSKSTEELLGCTYKEGRQHIENQFAEGMNWDNYGLHGWHIDHIMPCASFDLSDPEQQKECFHYTNLQPLWAEDNLKKSDKILTQ